MRRAGTRSFGALAAEPPTPSPPYRLLDQALRRDARGADALYGDSLPKSELDVADMIGAAAQAHNEHPRRVGLPGRVRGCLFDLDGVLTQTATVHASAWKAMFDAFLEARSRRLHEPFVPFDVVEDYDTYVDGRPRLEGVRAFLASRGIELPEGAPDDRPWVDTVAGLGRRKNDLVLRAIEQHGVEVYAGSVAYVRAVREAGLATAVVSSSRNCRAVLDAAGIQMLFDARVDGAVAAREHLQGKPAPDTFAAAASRLGLSADAAAVFEDAEAGVEAGRAGGFAYVVGVDRVGHAEALRAHGADIVVTDLGELLVR